MPAPTDVTSAHTADFSARQRTLRLGAVTVRPAAFEPSVYRRTPRLVRAADPEAYQLVLVLRGSVRVAWADRGGVFGPGEVLVNDTSRTYTSWAGRGRKLVELVAVELPRFALPLLREEVDRVIGTALPGRDGVGAELAGFLIQLARDTASFRGTDGPRLGTALTDLVSALVSGATEDRDARPTPRKRQRVLAARIRTFVYRHLHDPSLGPAAIAAAHHISTSYLHRLFREDGGPTVAAWIRRQRLEQARRELADPTLRALPIHRIAARCGFSDHAAFTRAFRDGYGFPPRELRPTAR